MILRARKGERFSRPKCLIAHTIKGKGVKFMENNLLWHYRSPSEDEFKLAIHELGNSDA
jgi:transketolase